MPSYAKVMSDALKEDKFDKTFSNGMGERIEGMNNAQLSGIMYHLRPTVGNSKFHIWRDANAELMNNVNKTLSKRLDVIEKEAREDEIVDTKIHNTKEKIVNRKLKKQYFVEQTRNLARMGAEKEVIEFEKKRKAEEKITMLKQQPMADEKRLQYIIYGLIVFIAGVTGSHVLFASLAIKIPLMLLFIGLSGYIFYLAYDIGIVKRKVVTEEELESAISIREEELFLKSMHAEKKRKAENKAAEKVNKEYRKKKKAEEAEKKRLEDFMMNANLNDFQNNIALLAEQADDHMDFDYESEHEESWETADDIEAQHQAQHQLQDGPTNINNNHIDELENSRDEHVINMNNNNSNHTDNEVMNVAKKEDTESKEANVTTTDERKEAESLNLKV